MDHLDVRVLREQINDLPNTEVKRIEELSDGRFAFDFRIREPPDVAVPKERGASVLRSVITVDSNKNVAALTLRFPPLLLDNYPGEDIERTLRMMLTRIGAPEPGDHATKHIFIDEMVDTGIPHYKMKRKSPRRRPPAEEIINFTRGAIGAFNDEFY